MTKLSKFHALCLFWIFFSCPKDVLAACLELVGSATKVEVCVGGQQFLNLVTSMMDNNDADQLLDSVGDRPKSCKDSTTSDTWGSMGGEETITDDNNVSKGDSSVPINCLLMPVMLHICNLLVWISCNIYFSLIHSMLISSILNFIIDYSRYYFCSKEDSGFFNV